jgi:hypothetical protein
MTPLTLPVALNAAVSRAYWKLAEVMSGTPAWAWAVEAALRQQQPEQKGKDEIEGRRERGARPLVLGLDLGAAPGGWSYQVKLS